MHGNKILGNFSTNPITSTTAQNMSIAMLETRCEYHSFSCDGIFLKTWWKIGIARNVHNALPSTIRPNTNILNLDFISSSFWCQIMMTALAMIRYAIHHQVAVTSWIIGLCRQIFCTKFTYLEQREREPQLYDWRTSTYKPASGKLHVLWKSHFILLLSDFAQPAQSELRSISI